MNGSSLTMISILPRGLKKDTHLSDEKAV
ncbi:uncharacterized protein METZ01_LOCUS441738 [marine metagenome]|uniref:Uncharacterized protein n=1 Tax=marine metagenome TaxID=408172 RepID=A0A382Z035_9ZZZZ